MYFIPLFVFIYLMMNSKPVMDNLKNNGYPNEDPQKRDS